MTDDILSSGGSRAELSDIIILTFAEVGILDAGSLSFGGAGAGTIACRILFVYPGCTAHIDGEGGSRTDISGGEKGTLAFISPHPDERLSFEIDGDIGARIMYVDYLSSTPISSAGRIYVSPLDRRDDLQCYVDLIRRLYYRYYTEGETSDILTGCGEAAAAFVNYAPASTGVPQVTDTRVISALRAVRRDLRDITRAEAARAGGVSSVYLGELFEKNVGVSIGRYIREYRLCAAQLLTRRGMTTDEAAKTVGYNGGSSLARAKKHFRGDEGLAIAGDLGAGLAEGDKLYDDE